MCRCAFIISSLSRCAFLLLLAFLSVHLGKSPKAPEHESTPHAGANDVRTSARTPTRRGAHVASLLLGNFFVFPICAASVCPSRCAASLVSRGRQKGGRVKNLGSYTVFFSLLFLFLSGLHPKINKRGGESNVDRRTDRRMEQTVIDKSPNLAHPVSLLHLRPVAQCSVARLW